MSTLKYFFSNDKIRPTSHNNNNGHHIGHRKTGSTAKLIDPPLTYDNAHKQHITSSLTSSPTVQNGNVNGAAKLLNGKEDFSIWRIDVLVFIFIARHCKKVVQKEQNIWESQHRLP